MKKKTDHADIDKFLKSDGLDSSREQEIGQHIGYRYDVNLAPDMARCSRLPEKIHGGHGVGRPQLAGGCTYGLRRKPTRSIRPQHQRLGARAGRT